jgi:Sap, sulfolipid-1-addressing protein
VTVEITLLALASTVRPTSLAAVYAFLGTVAPRRLLTIYIAVGAAFTVGLGLLVIWVIGGIDINAGSDRTKAIAEIAGGLVALAFAVGVLTGRVGGRQADDAPGPGSRWKALLGRDLTGRTAALAGPATHVPGLFYVVALNLIVAHQPTALRGFAEVLLYNAIWFGIPSCALAVCIVRPATARNAVGAIEAWTRARSRSIMLTVSFGVGAALVVHGALTV